MRKAILLFLALALLACGSKSMKETKKFRNSLVDIAKAGMLQRLTDDGRSIYPIFAPGDTIVYYQRLLLTDIADTFAYFQDEIVKPYGVNINNRQMYTLEGKIDFPSNREIEVSNLPKLEGEETVWGVGSPDSLSIAFETIPTAAKEKTHFIYLTKGNSVRQLSFGDTACFVDRFSNTGRYLTAVYGTGPTWILIYDLDKNLTYRIERPSNDSASIDYLTSFSPDDSMMLFIRSEKKYKWGLDYFGDIWLLRFSK